MYRALSLCAVAVLLMGASAIVYDPGQQPQPSTMEGPLTVNGAVTMTSGPMTVNGPMSVTGATTLGATTAPSFTGGSGSFTSLAVSGTTSFGAVNMGALTTAGPNTLNGSTSVTGACTFSQPPTGVARQGALVRGASLAITLIGCTSLGTTTVAGATTKSGCDMTERPANLPGLQCRVTSANTVAIEVCAQVLGLGTAPAGTYGVSVTGE